MTEIYKNTVHTNFYIINYFKMIQDNWFTFNAPFRKATWKQIELIKKLYLKRYWEFNDEKTFMDKIDNMKVIQAHTLIKQLLSA